jgi:hypothetical protein
VFIVVELFFQQPTLCNRSRDLAQQFKSANVVGGDDIFERLYPAPNQEAQIHHVDGAVTGFTLV